MLPLKRLLLPVDFSPRSQIAARYARALVSDSDAEVTVLHVVAPPAYEATSLEAAGTLLDDLQTARVEEAQAKLKDYLADELKGITTRRVLLEGDPARRIVEYAEENEVDLIVMPTHGYGRFRRFILGSVTAKVLHDADRPICTGTHLEEPPAPKEIRFRKVAVAIDLGPETCKALNWASKFAEQYGAQLLVIHATPSLEGRTGEYFDPDWKQSLERAAREQIASLPCQAPKEAQIIIDSGDAPKVVCAHAEEQEADLLVIGRGSSSGIFGRLRANAYTIIRQSPCPVVSV